MECTHTQTGPQFIISSEGVEGYRPSSYAGIMLLTCQLGWSIFPQEDQVSIVCVTPESSAKAQPSQLGWSSTLAIMCQGTKTVECTDLVNTSLDHNLHHAYMARSLHNNTSTKLSTHTLIYSRVSKLTQKHTIEFTAQTKSYTTEFQIDTIAHYWVNNSYTGHAVEF